MCDHPWHVLWTYHCFHSTQSVFVKHVIREDPAPQSVHNFCDLAVGAKWVFLRSGPAKQSRDKCIMPGLNICLVLLVGKVRQGNLLPGCTSAAGDIVDCGIAVPRRRRVHLGDIVKSDTHLCLSELVVKIITASGDEPVINDTPVQLIMWPVNLWRPMPLGGLIVWPVLPCWHLVWLGQSTLLEGSVDKSSVDQCAGSSWQCLYLHLHPHLQAQTEDLPVACQAPYLHRSDASL